MAQIVQRLCYGLACNGATIEQSIGIASRFFFSMEMQKAVEYILLIPDDTTLKSDEVLDKIKNYIRSQRNIALDCVAFQEIKQAIELYNDLCAVWKSGGMHARKWVTNSKVISDLIPKDYKAEVFDLLAENLSAVKNVRAMVESGKRYF